LSYITQRHKKIIFSYLDTPIEERKPLKDFLRENHMTRVSYYKGELVYTQEHKAEALELRDALRMKREYVNTLGHNVTSLENRWNRVEKAIYDEAVRGKVSAQELYAKLLGKLIDKKEIKVGRLEGDDYYRIRNEAKRDIDHGGGGEPERDREVLAESTLFLEESRLDTEQDNDTDGSVAGLGLSSTDD